ncbi:hypothetical protein Poli38472_006593 [Pythium oligandrum]|uniref:FYVE-type domain-containing protein n=1 Tax=Pythium oligandrum TaxID=41045 RepID=A0A8K1C538_PYTOL|nr:hypothetical protein Poli38472_006593 [Pythium oligandrum]|eukprot:TMW56583.1 hypothetical protein Poli38472_006593 [Pythium oligandrum]
MMMTGMTGVGHVDARMFARSDAPHKESLPLAKNFFGQTKLTPQTAEDYETVLQALLEDAIDRSRKERIYGGVDESWRDIGSASNFKRYTKSEGSSQHYRLQGVVGGPMAGMMSLMYADRDRSMIERRKLFYGNAYDAQTLHVLRARTRADPHRHMAVRWEAFGLNSMIDSFKIDMCFLEYVGVTEDSDHQPVGFKITHSINLPQCGVLEKSHGLLRAEGTEIMLLRPTNSNNYTEVTMEGSLQLSEILSRNMFSTFLGGIAANLLKMPVVIQTRRLAAMKTIDKSMWVSANDRKACSMCLNRFGMLGKKIHCRSCGEVFCKSCVVTREGKDQAKFCKKCVVMAYAEDEMSLPSRTHSSQASSTRRRYETPSNASSHRRDRRDSHASTSSFRRERRDSHASSANHMARKDSFASSVSNLRDSFTSQQRLSETDSVMSGSVYNQVPHRQQYKSNLEKYVEREPSQASYASTVSSGFLESYEGDYSRPEGSVIYLDTKDMMREYGDMYGNEGQSYAGSAHSYAGSAHSYDSAGNSYNSTGHIYGSAGQNYGTSMGHSYGSNGHSYNSTGQGFGQTPPPLQAVENSLAHQRHLLKEMMSHQRPQSRSHRSARRASAMKLGTSPMKPKIKHIAFPQLWNTDEPAPLEVEADPGMPSPKGQLRRDSLITLETLDKIGTRHACPVHLIEETLPDFSEIEPRVDSWNHYRKPKQTLRRPSTWLLGATATTTPRGFDE